MCKQNKVKAPGRLIKASPTFDQLLSKYVNKKVHPCDRPAKRLHSPTMEGQAEENTSS